jgi:integrase
MTTKIRPARNGKGWEYDIRFRWPEGGTFRERKDAPVDGKSAALRWAQAREASLLAAGKSAALSRRVAENGNPDRATLDVFWPRFVRDHYRANRKKPSTIETAEGLYRVHLKEPLGAKRLDAITSADVAALKGALAKKSPKTVNNILSVLSRALHAAIEWGDLAVMPCKIGLLKVQKGMPEWYERHEYRNLIDAAKKIGPSHHLLVLLAGSAGLRRGEIIALKWTDLDIKRRHIHVQRGIWRKHEDSPKGGQGRIVPMTPELADALKAHRHLLGERVLYSEKGRDLSNRTVRNWMTQAQRRAGLVANGGIHLLRHTFCSHLAAAGAPAKAIQELAGHTDISTTQRYMHLSPGDRNAAMGALEKYHATKDEAPVARSA